MHSKAIIGAWMQIKSAPINTVMTCSVIAITLLLTATLLIAFQTLKQVANVAKSSNQATLYLKTESDDFAIKQWIDELKKNPLVQEVTFVSKDQALKELASQADYKEILSEVAENPLPAAIQLKLNIQDKNAVKQFATSIDKAPLVAATHLNFEWLERLSALIRLVQRLSYILPLALGLGVVFIINHAIQGATLRNQQEMCLLQLMGATLSYLRRPFLYTGLFLGLGSGLITLFLMSLLFLAFKHPLSDCLHAYNVSLTLSIFSGALFAKVLLTSGLLGLLGAWFAFHRYAKQL